MGLDLLRFYKENNFKNDGKFSYGIYRNRLISIIIKGSYVRFTITFNKPLNKEEGAAFSSEITKIKKENKVVQSGITTSVSVELTLYQSADINEEFYPVLDKVIDVVERQQMFACETCPMCGKVMPSNSPFLRIKDTAVQAHEECINQLEKTANGLNFQSEKMEKRNNLLTLSFSFLAMITFIGLTLVLSIYGYYGYVATLTGWLSFIIVKLIIRKFKVVATNSVLIILSIFSVLTCLISLILGLPFELAYENPDVSLSFIFNNYFSIIKDVDNNVLKILLFDSLFGVILLGSSIFFTVKQVNMMRSQFKRLK